MHAQGVGVAEPGDGASHSVSSSTVPIPNASAQRGVSCPGRSDAGESDLLACRHPDPAAASPTTSSSTLGQGEQRRCLGDPGTEQRCWGHPALRGGPCHGWPADWASSNGLAEGSGTGALGRGPWFSRALIPVPWQGQRRGARGRRRGRRWSSSSPPAPGSTGPSPA